jgi:DNA-binding NarL/FixJ family response regulator
VQQPRPVIAIVDPDERRRQACVIALKLELGAEIIAAADLPSLFAQLVDHPIIIVGDHPKSGSETDAISVINARYPRTAVIALRDLPDEGAAGADAVISPPVDIGRLVRLIEEFLHRR